MSSIFKILVFIGTVIICFDISSAQDPIWLKNNFHECLQLERDRLVMTAVIKRNSNTTFTARSAVFQISSNGDTIKECMLWGLYNGCERVLNKDCYCESQNDEQVTIVFTPVAKLSYIGKNVTVNVPCVYTEDSITSTELNISLSSFDKSPSLTVNNEEVDLSRQFVSSKVPALINFCCSTSSQPHCHAHIKRNNQIIDNRSHCVSFTETSSSYVPYTFFSTHCNQTSEIMNFMFFPEDDNTRRTNMLEVLGYCFLMILATVALKDIVIIFISFKCPGILRCFSVHSQDNKRLENKISTLQTDVLELKEKNKTLENQVSMLNEEIKNLKKQPQALKDDFREEEPNNVIANRLIGELKKEEDSTNYVGQEESKSHY